MVRFQFTFGFFAIFGVFGLFGSDRAFGEFLDFFECGVLEIYLRDRKESIPEFRASRVCSRGELRKTSPESKAENPSPSAEGMLSFRSWPYI